MKKDLAIIDWEQSTKLAGGSLAHAKEFLTFLANDLGLQLTLIKQAHNSKNIDEIKRLLHRLRGGLSYCSTPRINAVVERMESEIDHYHDIKRSISEFEMEATQLIHTINAKT